MHGKFVQISAVTTQAGIVLYALDEDGNIFERLVTVHGSSWIQIA